jgi:pimeloyl-ACP methyl ester carboxylesterase
MSDAEATNGSTGAAAPREDLTFESGGERCAAWLYRPDPGAWGEGPHPIVVLAHGFAGTRAARLWAYAERFRDAGIAALVFDYRYFGDSSGEPRQLLSIGRQHEDWRAAIAFARTLEGIDPARVALWGSSFSGGHVVAIAAEDVRIKAVIAQTPFADGPSTLQQAGVGNIVKLTTAGLKDVARAARGREPYRIPAVGRPGETAAMNQPDSYDGYHGLFEPGEEFRNEFCGRAALVIGSYRPGAKAPQVLCPLLVITCAGDQVTPPGPARKMAERAPQGRAIEYGPEWGGHFNIYVGELFEKTIADQIAFLREALGAGAGEAQPEGLAATIKS